MSRAPSLVVSFVVVAAALAGAGTAKAHCRTKTCDTEPSYGDVWDEVPQPEECVRNAEGCYVEGTPLHWPSACISFGVQRDGSESSDIDFDTAEGVIQSAFDTWAAADCGNGSTPSFRIAPTAPIACEHIEYNQDAPNANVFLFRENDWPYQNIGSALALTTVTYNVETAEIYDADVELNSHESTFTTTDDPMQIISDLASVVTHESGHFLGLSHSAVQTSVMRATGYEHGTIDMRMLTQDDINGICEVFPPGRSPGGDCEPRHGFSPECGAPPEEKNGCSVSSAPGGASPRSLVLAALFALAFGARRRQTRK